MKSDLNDQASALAKKIGSFPEVEAVVLAGSLASGTADSGSDIDLYVYVSSIPSAEIRLKLAHEVASVWEVDNRYWETEDLLVLNSGTKAELVWRDFGFIEAQTSRVLDRFEASVGYSTCFWSNLVNSRPLYDKTGRYTSLQKTADRPYPAELVRNIIKKNLPLLYESLSSYTKQTAQAELRLDSVAVNHRIAAFLASWFDILFALNHMPHPGEKKQVKILKDKGQIFPEAWESDINDLVTFSGGLSASELMTIMDVRLKAVLQEPVGRINPLFVQNTL